MTWERFHEDVLVVESEPVMSFPLYSAIKGDRMHVAMEFAIRTGGKCHLG